eukprot:TRINITY_DN1595_c0_g1_i1.p3 TRINITY_DN1595_c0_g1~~TRINITY_DN1595_c0_g1_i1.p3  ORF type:complete len:158 (-),score=12.89 TRINITY_DN1595_c0_g1_i1:368-772(-)
MLLKVVFLCAICVVFAQYPPLYPPYLADSCTDAGEHASHMAADEACDEVYDACMVGPRRISFTSETLPPVVDISLKECQSLYVSKCEGLCNSKYFNCLVKYPELNNPDNCVLPDLFFNYCENRCHTGFIISVYP